MFYSFKNTKITLNNTGVLANAAEVSVASANDPNYILGERHTSTFSAEDGIGGRLRFSYNLTGRDFISGWMADETTLISGSFGGLHFQSGYLTSYSIKAEPNAPPTIAAEVAFFDELKGSFSPTYEKADEQNFLSFSDATFTDLSGTVLASTDQIKSLTYSFSSDVQPVYKLGDTVPGSVVFGKKETRTRLETDIMSGNMSISGQPVGVSFNFRHPSYTSETITYRTQGILHGRELSTSVGDILVSTLSIRQNIVEGPPVITSVSASSGPPGFLLTINGYNLKQASSVHFKDAEASFSVVNDTQITATVPSGAISGPVRVGTFGGQVYSSTFTVTQPSITVSSLTPTTGEIGSSIRISGDQFYRIDNVFFTGSDISGNFTVVSPAIIDVTVPYGAAWGALRVGSTERGVTGISSQLFVPKPRVEAFSPASGLSGITISISGVGFSGVTGVAVNNLTGTFTVIGNTGINFTIPSGNVTGPIRVSGQSGVIVLSPTNFLAFAHVTSLTPSSGRTGSAITISGENFQTSNMLSLSANNYLVGFQGASGQFTRTNSQTLAGTVPSGAKSGIVFVYAPDYSTYPSTITWNLIHDEPTVATMSPSSGKRGDYVSVYGTNYYNVLNILLTGNATGAQIAAASLAVGTFADVVNFQIPPELTGGKYDVAVRTRDGATTGSSLLTVMVPPHISGFSTTSGIIGQEIRLSGLNFYPGSIVYYNETGTQCAFSSGSLSTNYDALRFTVPTTANGTGYIMLDNSVDIITGASFSVIFKPEISGFTGTSGSWGDTIQLSGLHLNNTIRVYVGTGYVSTSVTAVSSTGLFFTIPNNSITDFIYVSGSGGLSISNTPLGVLVPPAAVSGFTPPALHVNKEVLLISGAFFNTVKEVNFSGSGTQISVTGNLVTGVGTTGIRLLVPAFVTGGPINVVNDSFTTQSTAQLIIAQNPILTSFGPMTGYFGQTVAATGANFTANTFFYFPSFTGMLVRANNTTISSSTAATFTVPREIIGGPILVSGSGELISSVVNFIPLPTISGFAPTGIGSTGYITISGINAFSCAPIFGITGESGEIMNIVDPTSVTGNFSQMLNAPGTTTGFAIWSGRVNDNFIGSGRLFLIPSGDRVRTDLADFTGSETYKQFSAPLYSSSFLQISGIPSISGVNFASGGSGSVLTLSGFNFLRVTGISFTNGTITTTGILSGVSRQFATGTPWSGLQTGSGQITLLSRYGNASTTAFFTFYEPLSISGFYPNIGITGSNFTLSGIALSRATGVFLSGYQASFTATATGLIVTIPPVLDLVQRGYYPEVRSANNNAISSSVFTVAFAGQNMYGNVTILSGVVASTGIMILATGISTGNINLYEYQSGNYMIAVADFGGIPFRLFSYRL